MVRQAMENEGHDIKEVRQAANKVVHCGCMSTGCPKYKRFVAVCKRYNVDIDEWNYRDGDWGIKHAQCQANHRCTRLCFPRFQSGKHIAEISAVGILL